MPTFFHGDHASVFVAGNYLRGLKDFDLNRAYKLLVNNATVPGKGGRPYLAEYIEQGWICLLYTSERRCELAIEGTRLYDIRRWKTIETALNGNPRGAKFAADNTQYIQLDKRAFNKDRDYLFAIPQSQRDINKNLTQNPGY